MAVAGHDSNRDDGGFGYVESFVESVATSCPLETTKRRERIGRGCREPVSGAWVLGGRGVIAFVMIGHGRIIDQHVKVLVAQVLLDLQW